MWPCVQEINFCKIFKAPGILYRVNGVGDEGDGGGGGIWYVVAHPRSGLRDVGSCISNVAGCGAHMLQCTETVTP